MAFEEVQEAATIVTKRFHDSLSLEESGFNDAYAQIPAIINAAKAIVVGNIGVSVSVENIDIPESAPYISLLDVGRYGLPAAVEQAIYEAGLERARQVLDDRLDLVRLQWAKRGWPAPNGALARMMMVEIDKYEEDQRVKNLGVADKSISLAADFARTLLNLVSQWSTSSIRLRNEQGIDEANIRLKQAEVAINQIVERMKLAMSDIKGVAEISSMLVSAAFVGTSASASIHAGHTDSIGLHASSSDSTVISHDDATNIKVIEFDKTHERVVNDIEGTDTTTDTEREMLASQVETVTDEKTETKHDQSSGAITV